MKKYTFTDETITIDGTVLHRIKALADFNDVKNGELGGFIEKKENLSYYGFSWVYDEAKVFGDAMVSGNATIHNNAQIFGDAHIYGNTKILDSVNVYDDAIVSDNAIIYGCANIFGNARIYDHAMVFGCAKICDDARIYDYAMVFGCAKICDNAIIHGNARVYDCAEVYGHAEIWGYAKVCKNAIVYKSARITGTAVCISNIHNDIEESIRVQTGLIPINGEVIAYKQVNKDLSSFYDGNFVYKIGEYVEVDDADMSDNSCSTGLHFSNATYWNSKEDVSESTFLIAKIKIEDIITVQKGKIRCKRAFIMGKYDIKE